MGACTPTARMRPSNRRFAAVKRSEMAGIESLRALRLLWPTRRKPVKGGLVVDARAHLLDITSTMDALPIASSAACSDVGLLQWQAVLPWILTARLLEAPLRLPSWLNDDLRPVPRLQLSWASEFNSPVGLLQWRSSTSYEGVLPRSRTMADPAVVHGLQVLDGSRL